MPNKKVIKAQNVPTLVKHAGCLWQRSGSAVGWLGPSDRSSRRFSGRHTTPAKWLSSSTGREWGLRASSHRGRCARVLGVSWQFCLNSSSRCGLCRGTPSRRLGPGQLSTRAFPPWQQYRCQGRSDFPPTSAHPLTLSAHTQPLQNPDRGWTPSPFPLFVLLLLAKSLNQMINGSIDFVCLSPWPLSTQSFKTTDC